MMGIYDNKEPPQINIVDYRTQLPQDEEPKTAMMSTVRYITLHYNGQAVGDRTYEGELKQLRIDADWHMRVGTLSPYTGADGIQYHFAVLSNGTVLKLRDFRQLWHCANAEGNAHSVAVHLPLGGRQDASTPQWEATTKLLELLMTGFCLPGRHLVRGHCEWPRSDGKGQSQCPGPILMERLRQWRGEDRKRRQYEVVVNAANVRESPWRHVNNIALGGQAVMGKGNVFLGDAIVRGENIGGTDLWVHRADGIGFVHMSLLREV